MRYVFIVNPTAGKKNPEETILPVIRAYMDKHKLSYACHITERVGHATELAKNEIEKGGPLRIYAVGGDGTFREIAAAAANNPLVEVGVFPCGSGDDYIRNFACRELFLKVEKQLSGKSRPVDLMETDYGLTVNVGCIGLDGKVAYRMVKYKRIPFLPGPMAYSLALFQSLFGKLGNTLEVTIDKDKVLKGDFVFALSTNGGWYGGGYYAAPKAVVDDGFLEIVLVKVPKFWKIPKMVRLYKKGLHMEAPEFSGLLEYCRAKEIKVESVREAYATFDGECVRTKHMESKILPGALRFIVPAE